MSGAAGAGYYCGGGGVATGRESYYTDAVVEGEPAGKWSGKLAEMHGLTGEVAEDDLARLLGKFEAPDGTRLGSVPRAYRSVDDRVAEFLESNPDALPEDIAAVRSRAEDETRSSKVAYDLTLSVPKSVSAAHTAVWRAELEAERSGDESTAAEFRAVRTGIESAIETANAAALDCVTDVARTRAGAHGRAGTAGRWVPVDGVATASFFQHTSRSIDPQLHVHNVTFARALDTEGEVRAIDSADLRDQRKAFSAVSERVLAEEMARLGLVMEVRPDGLSREVVGVPQDVMDLFSSRRQAISERMRPLVEAAEERFGRPLTDLETSRIAQRVTLFSRAAKSHDGETFEEMLDRWQGEVRGELATGLVPLAERLRAAHQQGPAVRDGSFSPAAVIGQAVAACAEKSPAWNRAELLLQLERALPLTGLSAADSRALLEQLADQAVTSPGVEQVGGRDVRPAPTDLIGEGVTYVRPSAEKWAAPVTLDAENLIRRAAVERGGHSLDQAAVSEWLDERYPTISPDQRAVVEGLASSDARLAQLVAAAGTGKSFASGALAGAWAELSGGGKVQGLTVSEVAAQVLRGDGVETTRNLTAWLAAQDRLASGRGLPVDQDVAVSPLDVLLVDEASMVGTAQLDRVRAIAEAAGARVVLAGDPQQLSAVDAGGALSLLDGRAETYTLSEVRRFEEAWEAEASLRLRDGDLSALAEYDRRGRIVDAATLDEAVLEAGRRTAADLIEGRDAIAVAGSNDLAARIATAVRDQLVAAGHVEAEGVHLPMDGTTAAIGDRIMTRSIDRNLGVLNRERWTVVGTGEDGSLSVVDAAGRLRELPAEYVGQHVQSGYSGTAHAVQGVTVDRAVTVQDGSGDLASVYVPATRGRQRNTLIVALQSEPGADAAGPAKGEGAAPTGRAVLAGMLQREVDNQAARVQQERDAEWNASMSTVAGKLEDVTHLATLERLGRDLDQLTAEGVLDEQTRARLCADQSVDHLARVVRAAEQSGGDALDVLRQAVEGRELTTATSVAQVIASRIERSGAIEGTPARTAPERLPGHWQAHYDELQEAARDRTRVLGSSTSEQAPTWAVTAFGPVPDDPVARLDWEARAGAVAAFREAKGWTSETVPIGGPGRRTDTENRALFVEAWEALGNPEAGRAEAGMTDGQLQARVAAWQREQAWAPAHADKSLRAAELDAEQARVDATLARSAGDVDQAAELDAVAERRAAVARGMGQVAEGRAAWAGDVAWTRAAGEGAAHELKLRGKTPGQEPDRTTAAEWLAAEKAARLADDEHRVITEADVLDVEADAVEVEAEAVDIDGQAEEVQPAAEVEPVADEIQAPAAEPVAVTEEPAPEPPEEVDTADERPAAHEVAPLDPSEVELEAMVTTATAAIDREADRASEEAAHQASERSLTEYDVAQPEPAMDWDSVAAAG